jgi:hypothetical protein
MVEELENRKAKLRQELREIEGRLESSVKSLGGLFDGLLPTGKIRRFPIRSVAFALAFGFMSGIVRVGRRSRTRGVRGFLKLGLSGIILGELKRVAAQRAVRYVSDLADQTLRNKFNVNRASKAEPAESESSSRT